ncbi:hypothetical protein [Streptomyces sp. NPDC057623]|uniref:hypothetical protein n=1 Tax=Streptomyces sp. NPDC057623 TaxID=3346187 RepID=UPI0036BA4F1C
MQIAGALQGKRLAPIDITTDDDKVGTAVDDLNETIADYDRAVLNSATDPDSSRIRAGSMPWRRS